MVFAQALLRGATKSCTLPEIYFLLCGGASSELLALADVPSPRGFCFLGLL